MKLNGIKSQMTTLTLIISMVGCGSNAVPAKKDQAATKTKDEQTTEAPATLPETPAESQFGLKFLQFKEISGVKSAKLNAVEIDAVKQLFFVGKDSMIVNARGELVSGSLKDLNQETLKNLPYTGLPHIIKNIASIGNHALSAQNQGKSVKAENIWDERVCMAELTSDPQLQGTALTKGDWARWYRKTSQASKTKPGQIEERATLEGSANLTGIAKNCRHTVSDYDHREKLIGWNVPNLPAYPEYPQSGSDIDRAEYERKVEEYRKEWERIEASERKALAEKSHIVDGEVKVQTEFSIEASAIRGERNLLADTLEQGLEGVTGRARGWSLASGKLTSTGYDSQKNALVPQSIELVNFGVYVEMNQDHFKEIRTVGTNNMLTEEANKQDLHDFIEETAQCVGSVRVNGVSYSCEAIVQVLIDLIVEGRI